MINAKATTLPAEVYPYLNEIAARLHSGHAAIMVGSGFSKNAKPRGNSISGFPDWSELGDIFYQTLNKTKPNSATRYLNVPTLAHEVEAAIGRPALDQILRNAIPDEDYEPSKLHQHLLELP